MKKNIFLVLIFFLLAAPLKANLFLPSVYVKGGLINQTVELSEHTFTYTQENSTATGYIAGVGVRPFGGIVPVLGSLRAEVQNTGTIFNNKVDSSSTGLIVYYDVIRLFGIVNPYVGVGKQQNRATDYKSGFQTTLHAGFSSNFLVLPVNVFLEYRHAISTKSESEKRMPDCQIDSGDLRGHTFMFGIQYTIF